VLIIVILAVLAVLYFVLTPKSSAPTVESQNGSREFSVEGVGVKILKPGDGSAAKVGDLVTVNYLGRLTDGTKFDSSYDRNQPFSFTLGQGQVIKGWEIGVAGMKVGEKRELTIPPELGYGAAGTGPIPPNATLIFEVELLNIEK